jgi:hypothetical protein
MCVAQVVDTQLLEAGEASVELGPTDVPAIVRDVCQHHRGMVAEGVELLVAVASGVPLIQSDGGRIAQARARGRASRCRCRLTACVLCTLPNLLCALAAAAPPLSLFSVLLRSSFPTTCARTDTASPPPRARGPRARRCLGAR